MSANFLVASLSIDGASSGSTDWVVGAGTPYRPIDVIDFPAATLERVHSIYRDVYDRLGPLMISSPDELFKYDRWFLIYGVDAVPQDSFPPEQDLAAFALCRQTSVGMKLGLMARSSQPGAQAILKFAVSMLHVPGVFAEVSDRPETYLAGRVPIVNASDAIRILRRLGHPDVERTRDQHYTRMIQGVGRREKLMVGLPRSKRTSRRPAAR